MAQNLGAGRTQIKLNIRVYEVSTNERQHQGNKHEYVYNESKHIKNGTNEIKKLTLEQVGNNLKTNTTKATFTLTFTVEAISFQDRNTDISVKKFVTSRKSYCTLIIQCSGKKNSHRSVPYDAQSQQYPSRQSAGLSRPITDVAVCRVISRPVRVGGTGLVRPQCCRARCRLDDQ